jgi:hypothetical protein
MKEGDMASAANEFFAKIPEFTAAFGNLSQHGYFLEAEFRVMSHRGMPQIVSLKYAGIIPASHSKRKLGLTPVLSPYVFLNNLRELFATDELRIKNSIVEVKSENGDTKDSTNVTLRIHVVLAPVSKRKLA